MEKPLTPLRAHTTPGDKPRRMSSATARLPSATVPGPSPGGPRSGRSGRRLELRSQASAGSLGRANLPTPAPQLKLQNTYRMTPVNNARFRVDEVEHVVKDTLDAYLHKVKYNADNCSRLAHNLVSVIKGRVKELGQMDRYRLVVQVMLGQDSDQGIQQASRCLWNPDTDNFAAATYRNNSVYAIAVVYGLYLD